MGCLTCPAGIALAPALQRHAGMRCRKCPEREIAAETGHVGAGEADPAPWTADPPAWPGLYVN